MTASSIKTTCAYCGVGCGINAKVIDQNDHLIEVQGLADHPANYGRLCSKGSALGETVSLENRLLSPKLKGQTVSWDKALDEVATRLQDTLEHYGPESVAIYASGQLLTEDYYVANKLMKGFIGSANIDTNSRLCMSSTVAAQKRAYGEDIMPGCYEDLELADLVVLTGSNMAWCHPVLFQRLRAEKERRPEMKVVVIDPRRTDTCEIADLHLPIKAGTDVLLFSGLLAWLEKNQCLDINYIDQYTTGFDAAVRAASSIVNSDDGVSSLAYTCGIEAEKIERFYQLFSSTHRTVTAWSQGINQSAVGTDKVNAIINCHLATGRIGKPGAGPLSLTGQPNAMGGREVGGLANQLAAHMDFSEPDAVDRVRRFWKAPRIATKPGLTAIELFNAIDDGAIRFVWIMGTNPVVSLPDANRYRQALKRCPNVVVSDCIYPTDTGMLADILLPACGWSEKSGTVTNSERRISRQRALFSPSGEARPDWWIISQVASRLGFDDAFDYGQPADIFREHAALSGFENSECPQENKKRRGFDISGLAEISNKQYEIMEPVSWPFHKDQPPELKRLFDQGDFFTEDKKGRFIPVTYQPQSNRPDTGFPLLLNTGRVRDHWHTMTRTGLSPRLGQHSDEPYLDVHPEDAWRYGLTHQGLCRVSSAFGSSCVRVRITEAVQPGAVFMPMHWTRQNSRTGHCGVIVNPVVDKVSFQPDFKHTPVNVQPIQIDIFGVCIRRNRLDLSLFDHVTEVRCLEGFRYEFAGQAIPEILYEANGEKINYQTGDHRDDRSIWFYNNQVEQILITGETIGDVDRLWLQELLVKELPDTSERWRLLAGQPPVRESAGKIICACFGVGEKTICQAITCQNMKTPEAIGAVLKAGTNCGSCLPELSKLIEKNISPENGSLCSLK